MKERKKRRSRRTRTPGLFRMEKSRIYPDGAWEVRYRDADNATRRKTFRTKPEALDFQAKVRTDKATGELISPQRAATLFRDVAEKWFETMTGHRPKTVAGCRQMLDKHLLPAFGHYPIGRIRPSDLQEFLARLPGNLSPTTKRNIFRSLGPIFRMAIRDGMIRTNPCVGVKLPKAQRKEMLYLSAEQVEALAQEVRPPYDLLVHFAAYTGLRAGEIVALRVRNVDLLRRRVRVVAAVSDVKGKLYEGPPKNGRPRTVPLPGFLLDRLTSYMAGKGQGDYVFTGAQGGILRHSNWYGRSFKPAVRRALPDHLHGLRFHDLRHTAASLLIAQGTHPKAVSEWLGHSSIAITMDTYGHLFPGHEEAIVQGLDNTYKIAAAEIAVSASVVPLG